MHRGRAAELGDFDPLDEVARRKTIAGGLVGAGIMRCVCRQRAIGGKGDDRAADQQLEPLKLSDNCGKIFRDLRMERSCRYRLRKSQVDIKKLGG